MKQSRTKIITQENFEYLIKGLEERVESGEFDVDDVIKTLRKVKDGLFYPEKVWQKYFRLKGINFIVDD